MTSQPGFGIGWSEDLAISSRFPHSGEPLSADGARIVCDPFGCSYPSGLDGLPKDPVAQVVTVSHAVERRDHVHAENAGAGGGGIAPEREETLTHRRRTVGLVR
ncbi:MAG: hypothetical protein NT080_07795 [Spirochaetes bacterium]|nr:hypothetical protein [Spirochaetota bacterium]